MKPLILAALLVATSASAQFLPRTGAGGSGGMSGLQGGVEVVSVDAPSLPSNECVDVLTPVPGVLDNDYVQAQALCELAPSIFVDGTRASGESTVSVRICNLSSTGAEDPLPCDFQFLYARAPAPAL